MDQKYELLLKKNKNKKNDKTKWRSGFASGFLMLTLFVKKYIVYSICIKVIKNVLKSNNE